MRQRSTKETYLSNGYRARGLEDGSIKLTSGSVHLPIAELSAGQVEALAPVVQDDRDLALGRWRSEVKDWMVCYPIEGQSPTNDSVRVLNERDGGIQHYSRKDRVLQGNIVNDYEYAARAYFNAHKLIGPWVSPDHNDIWELSFQDGSHGAYVANTEHHTGKTVYANASTYLFADSESIRHGKRIYPKATS